MRNYLQVIEVWFLTIHAQMEAHSEIWFLPLFGICTCLDDYKIDYALLGTLATVYHVNYIMHFYHAFPLFLPWTDSVPH